MSGNLSFVLAILVLMAMLYATIFSVCSEMFSFKFYLKWIVIFNNYSCCIVAGQSRRKSD